MNLLARIICRLLGHRFLIIGVTDKYRWCDRCGKRIETSAARED